MKTVWASYKVSHLYSLVYHGVKCIVSDQRDSLTEQVDKQKETNKLVVKQLKDWETLGARLKSEVRELMNQLSKKNNELDGVKTEMNKQREQIEVSFCSSLKNWKFLP